MEDIYKLKLLQNIRIDNDEDGFTVVKRVPGGWIFTENEINRIEMSNDTIITLSSVFVPYNEEFRTKTKTGGF